MEVSCFGRTPYAKLQETFFPSHQLNEAPLARTNDGFDGENFFESGSHVVRGISKSRMHTSVPTLVGWRVYAHSAKEGSLVIPSFQPAIHRDDGLKGDITSHKPSGLTTERMSPLRGFPITLPRQPVCGRYGLCPQRKTISPSLSPNPSLCNSQPSSPLSSPSKSLDET